MRWLVLSSVGFLGACAAAPAQRVASAVPSPRLPASLAAPKLAPTTDLPWIGGDADEAPVAPPRPSRALRPPPSATIGLIAPPPYTPPEADDDGASFKTALDLLPLADEHGRFVLVRTGDGAELLDTSKDARIATYADEAALDALLAHTRSWRRLLMMDATPEESNVVAEQYTYRDHGLRARYAEPDLTVDVEATGTIVSRRHATWWSAPEPPETPGEENLPPEERFRCPKPLTVVRTMWITPDHGLLVMFADHEQYVCVCGDASEGGRWHVVQLPRT